MNEEARKEFVIKELEAIYEEMDNSVNQLVILRKFLKNLVDVSKGAEPDYDNLIEIINKWKK
jgi:hypothetical protein